MPSVGPLAEKRGPADLVVMGFAFPTAEYLVPIQRAVSSSLVSRSKVSYPFFSRSKNYKG